MSLIRAMAVNEHTKLAGHLCEGARDHEKRDLRFSLLITSTDQILGEGGDDRWSSA